MSQLLQFLWQQINPNSLRLSASMIERWSIGKFEELLRIKLIVETDIPSTSVTCDACDRDHSSKVVWLDYPDGQRAFIACPDTGRVPVDAERLKQWDIDYSLLAELTTSQVPGKLTRACVERIRLAEFTSEDQSKILDLLGNFAPTELTPVQKRRDSEVLRAIVEKLTTYQAAILDHLWYIPVSVDWDELPDSGFREGNNRSDSAVKRALERLNTDLADLKLGFQIELEIIRPKRRVTLIRPRR